MAEFVAEIEDWSLQAIVRGSSGDYTKSVDIDMDDDQTSLLELSANHHDQKFDRQFLAGFPEIFEVSTGSSDELEELYKAFYPVSDAIPAQAVLAFQEKQPQIDVAEDKQQALDPLSGSSSAAIVTSGYTTKYKKRKNQHKRVVMQVSAEGLASDMWAWRKYGQKPIKGSPYPRSYYRCSSLKGCLARKQVEKSCTDPGMFIITYTAEHSHSLPTRRNSLAGTVRQKFPSKNPNNKIAKQEKANQESTSPKAEVANFNQTKIKEENKDENEEVVKGESHNDEDFMMSDFVFNEDFFSGLEDFEELISEMPLCHAQQFPVRSCS